MRNIKLILFTLGPLLLASQPAHAYIGPGLGAGAIAAVLGILGSIILAFFGILWYPIKRLIRKLRSDRDAGHAEAAGRHEG